MPAGDDGRTTDPTPAAREGASRRVLGPGGPFAAKLRGYEAREAQLAMADAVERAVGGDRILVCEAGTGTGKTLAYLVPALLSGRKVVVSTATKALQEQIFAKDLPLLAAYTGLRFDAVLVKGVSNYVCRRRFQEFRSSPEGSRPANAAALDAVARWLEETDSGDLSELATLGENDPVRLEIAASTESRAALGCSQVDNCFVAAMRREAERARLLVVNHHLVLADLALKGDHSGGALPTYEVAIFDEAHQLEDVATDFFGVRVSSARIDTVVRDATRAFQKAGLSDKLFGGGGDPLLGQVSSAAAAFFVTVGRFAPPDGGRQTLEAEAWGGDLSDAYHRLDAALEAVFGLAETKQSAEPIEVVARRIRSLRDDLATVVDRPRGQVAWVEAGQRSVSLGCSPVDVAGVLKDKLFDVTPASVLTSATLATSSGFSFLRTRLGLVGNAAPVDELALASPFDFGKNALLYVSRDLPEVNEPDFFAAAGARTAELIAAAGGGAFVLCTSVRSMRALHSALSARRVRGLLRQGDAPKGALLAKFRADGHAVLVATMSFWEGVDVPGDALRLVVIDKIPFPVPSDPVVAARGRVLEEAGVNPFTGYHVPSAAITLKQGFGRLLRTATDRGVVALLDRRVLTRGYGKAILASLPPAPRTERLDDVRAFFTGPRPGA